MTAGKECKIMTDSVENFLHVGVIALGNILPETFELPALRISFGPLSFSVFTKIVFEIIEKYLRT